MTDAPDPRGKYLVLLICLVAAARLFLAWDVPMTDTTEARYANMARMMAETGDWITPYFDYGVPFWGKPPLHTWLAAFGIAVLDPLFGWLGIEDARDMAARLPILLTSALTIWLIHTWVTRLRGPREAWVAAVVLASSALFFGASAFVMTDMPLTLGATMAMVGFHLGVGAQDGRPDRRWALIGFLGLAVGLLAKGPIALVLFGLPALTWLALGNRWRLLAGLPWAGGVGLVLVTVLPWYVAAEIKTPGFLRYFIIGEHYERFVIPGWTGDLYGSGHERPKGIIWPLGLAMFLPWTLFALLPLTRARRVWARRGDTGILSYLMLFAAAPMILFTPAANILAAYTLPGLPAAAALLAITWTMAEGPTGRAMSWVLGAAAMIVPLLLVLALGSPTGRPIPLRTSEAAVRYLSGVEGELRVSALGGRLFSLDYYTDGTAGVVQEGEVATLLGDGVRDALVVRDRENVIAVPTGFDDLGRFDAYRLFLERPPG